ncbi:hypothetical protein F4859DRAFT_472370 [Xylaria cf. heliscus]|nr:hypothetical protein F4859DRAFT_472370 [Xylaria cf. heliscus]
MYSQGPTSVNILDKKIDITSAKSPHHGFATWLQDNIKGWGEGGVSSDDWNTTLQTESISLAKVLWCGQRLTSWIDASSGLHTVGTWMRAVIRPQSRSKFESDDQRTMWRFMRTLVGGICLRAGRLDRIHVSDRGRLSGWFKWSLLPRLRDVCSIDEEMTRVVDHIAELYSSETSKNFGGVMRLVTEGRVFFQTEDGHMGLGPASMAAEDEIHVLPGGRTHFVLRPEPESGPRVFEIIGDCFLDQDPGESDRGERKLNGSLPREILDFMYLGSGLQIEDGRRRIFLK